MPSEWTDLIWDVKRQIIGLLDYESRCNLRICSKQNKIHVDSTKFVANKLFIREFKSRQTDGKSTIRIDIDGFTIWFIGKDHKTKVERNWNGVLSELEDFKQENRFHVAKRYIDKFLVENDNISVNCLSLQEIKFTPLKHWKIKCQEMTFNSSSSSVRWLRQTNPNLRKLFIDAYIYGNLDELPQIMNVSESLRVRADNKINLSDELLRTIETPDIELDGSNFTLEGIKLALDRFLRIGRKGDRFEVTGQRVPRKGLFWKELVKSLKVKMDGGQVVDENNEEVVQYDAKITGGFVNLHGVQDIRELHCFFYDCKVWVSCEIWEKPKNLNYYDKYPMYPFTACEKEYIGWSELP